MAVSILYCTFLGLSRATFGLCRLYRGVTRKSEKKVALASPGRRYVRFLEMCYNPIGRDDTRGSDVWGLYRDGLYPRKKLKKNEEPRYRRIIENGEKKIKIHCFFITLTWDEKLGMKRPLSILQRCRSVDLNGSKREIRCSRDENWKKKITVYGLKKIRKNSRKMTDFS